MCHPFVGRMEKRAGCVAAETGGLHLNNSSTRPPSLTWVGVKTPTKFAQTYLCAATIEFCPTPLGTSGCEVVTPCINNQQSNKQSRCEASCDTLDLLK
jgi:hypothetical protein